jgi:lipoprotein-anchoring transpeptidase ErfK/SrfK
MLVAVGATALMGTATVDARFERDISRIVFNDNLELLENLRRHAGAADDSLLALLEVPEAPSPPGAIIISITDNRLWYRVNDSAVFETRVATGSGKVLEKGPGGSTWKFETPRGRLKVLDKEEDPAWVPPDWHFIEQAKKRDLRLTKLLRGESIRAADGSEITVVGSDVVRRSRDGRVTPLDAADGREIVVDGQLIVPPFGTNQRRYKGVLGTHRLIMGNGYAIHGTNVPTSIGQSVSHGCVRLLNEDIAHLYEIVPVGTPVYIY